MDVTQDNYSTTLEDIGLLLLDLLLAMLKDQGVPCVPENGQTEENATTWVLEFPVKSPEVRRIGKGYEDWSYGPT